MPFFSKPTFLRRKVRIGSAIVCLVCSTAVGAPYGVNLLVNGNAESGPFSSTGATVANVPGWTTTGAFTVINYKATNDSSGFPKVTDAGPSDRGSQFFAGGNSEVASAFQNDIDVSGNATDIDSNRVYCDATAWLGGYADQDDQAVFTVTFKKDSFTALGAVEFKGPKAAGRNFRTSLLPTSDITAVPPGTRTINVSLVMTRLSPGTFNDAYADSLSVVLRGPAVVTNTNDSGPGSLRAALAVGSAITFDSTVFSPSSAPHVINVASSLPVVERLSSIIGPGAKNLTLRGAPGGITFFTVAPAEGFRGTPALYLSGMTMEGASSSALYNSGIADVTNCFFIGNTAGVGGAIINRGPTLRLKGCTFKGNSATLWGGAIDNYATGPGNSAEITATNCTFTGNTADRGGVIFSDTQDKGVAKTSLRNCTLTANSDTLNGSTVNGVSLVDFDNTILDAPGPIFSPQSGATFKSNGYNLTNGDGGGYFNASGVSGDRTNTNPMLGPLQDNGGPTPTHALLPGSLAIDKGDSLEDTDQRGAPRPYDDPGSANGGGNNSDIGAYEVTPGVVGNVSTRLPVGTDDNVLIQGFIVQGPSGSTRKIIVRAIGPSLAPPPFNIPDALADPTLEIRDGNNATIARNDNWRNTQIGGIITSDQSQQIATSGATPGNDAESAIIANLAPGSYTAVVAGSGRTVGTGVVDAYDLSPGSPARLANVATRGLIQPGDNLMIAGFLVQNWPVRVVVRAIGPSLAAFGINNAYLIQPSKSRTRTA